MWFRDSETRAYRGGNLIWLATSQRGDGMEGWMRNVRLMSARWTPGRPGRMSLMHRAVQPEAAILEKIIQAEIAQKEITQAETVTEIKTTRRERNNCSYMASSVW